MIASEAFPLALLLLTRQRLLVCRVLSRLASGGKVKQALFQAAMAETSRVRAAGGNPATVPLWNKLVFSKVRSPASEAPAAFPTLLLTSLLTSLFFLAFLS